MPGLIVSQHAARIPVLDLGLGELLPRLPVLIQQSGAKGPYLPGILRQNILHFILFRRIGGHYAVPVQHTDIILSFCFAVQFPVAHHQPHVPGVKIPGSGKERLNSV